MRSFQRFLFSLPVWALLLTGPAHALDIAVDFKKAKPISPDLLGIFFEDISYAADGGLYAELIQNRSFEYDLTEQPDWNALSYWKFFRSEGSVGKIQVDRSVPVHPNNTHYITLECSEPGNAGVGISNTGFDGIVVKQGEIYDVSFFSRQLWTNRRWNGPADVENHPMPVTVRLESQDGKHLGETKFEVRGREWKKIEGTLTATGSDPNARFALLINGRGCISLDEISLFPRKTFKNRRNGLRPDLAQAIADLHPRFVRFPGGCVAHGNGLPNIYHWKNTVGPIEQRKQMPNLWRYHQTMGLGYFEYFQFCEDLGAHPLPVVAAGVSCQHSGYTENHGQCAIPMEQMDAYVQDILDLIEWANGPATSRWGAVRVAAGHPEPFHLKYIGVGNEDRITPEFEQRFKMIHDAIRKAHPEIVVIGNSGPLSDGEDFEKGWELVREQKVSMVDEHYYKSPDWFWKNLRRYDTYDRKSASVYLGEYAAHDKGRRSTLRSALAEAAHLTALERNGDIVTFASYAPLLAKRGYTRWSPDLIYFTNTGIELTVNYHVQKLFGQNAGDTYLETTPAVHGTPADFAASTVLNSRSGEVVLKFVNNAATEKKLNISLNGADQLPSQAEVTVLADPDPDAVNEGSNAKPVLPRTSKLNVRQTFTYSAPANSLTVIRIPSK
ncbi:MAG: alpha-L-arabinofuranosidase C-terminal domain-containing protein [Luteolibacter sp.]